MSQSEQIVVADKLAIGWGSLASCTLFVERHLLLLLELLLELCLVTWKPLSLPIELSRVIIVDVGLLLRLFLFSSIKVHSYLAVFHSSLRLLIAHKWSTWSSASVTIVRRPITRTHEILIASSTSTTIASLLQAITTPITSVATTVATLPAERAWISSSLSWLLLKLWSLLELL